MRKKSDNKREKIDEAKDEETVPRELFQQIYIPIHPNSVASRGLQVSRSIEKRPLETASAR